VKTREVLKWMGGRWRADLSGSRVTACVGASTNDGLLAGICSVIFVGLG
jgi:hypothetical protein